MKQNFCRNKRQKVETYDLSLSKADVVLTHHLVIIASRARPENVPLTFQGRMSGSMFEENQTRRTHPTHHTSVKILVQCLYYWIRSPIIYWSKF